MALKRFQKVTAFYDKSFKKAEKRIPRVFVYNFLKKNMISTSNLKEAFKVEAKNGAFYQNGKVKTNDGSKIFCACNGTINCVGLGSETVEKSFNTSETETLDIVQAFTVSNDGDILVSVHNSGLFKKWNTSDNSVVQWKSIHKGPVSELDIHDNGVLLASGGSDAVVRIWNIDLHSCTHALRGATGVICVLKFQKVSGQELVFASGDNLKIIAWDLESKDLLFELSGHFSNVTGLSFHDDGLHLVSCSRDKVLILWNLVTKSSEKTLPVFESLEGVAFLHGKFELPDVGETQSGLHVATAGERGVIRIYDMSTGRELYTQTNPITSQSTQDGGLSVTQLYYIDTTNCFIIVTVDHNIVIYQLDTFNCVKQLIGFIDEVLDVVYIGQDDSHLAVATNSPHIKLYSVSNLSCRLFHGHTDTVLSLCVAPGDRDTMLSCGKDNSVRLWKFDPATQMLNCLCASVRHTSSVSSVCFSQTLGKFFVSVSHDTTLKLWTVDEKKKRRKEHEEEQERGRDGVLSVKVTQVAHEKDVNCVCVSPNDKLVATASQDKTAKLWCAETLTLLGTFRGHRRGVWSVRFSPVDQVLMTASADCSVKLWSIGELNCLKSLEGHEGSVLRAEFVTKGMQIVTASGDGLVKLWNVKTSECVASYEEHDGHVWALAVSRKEDKLVTGGSDSQLITWRDCTEEKRNETARVKEEHLQQEQQLSNLLHNKQLFAALSLALTMDRSFQTLKIIKEILKENKGEGLNDAIFKLNTDQKDKLMSCAMNWNCNSRNTEVSQRVIKLLLDQITSGQFKLDNLPGAIENVSPYTERHFKRLTTMLQDLYLLKYSTNLMKLS